MTNTPDTPASHNLMVFFTYTEALLPLIVECAREADIPAALAEMQAEPTDGDLTAERQKETAVGFAERLDELAEFLRGQYEKAVREN